MKSLLAYTLVSMPFSALVSATAGTLHIGIAAKRSPGSLSKRDSSSVSVTAGEDLTYTAYYANMTVGTPPQLLEFQLDTGSSDIWMIAKDAEKHLDGQPTPPGISGTFFDETASSTFTIMQDVEGQFDITYGDGTGATGDYFTDTVVIGGANMTGMIMGLARNVSTSPGLIGLGFKANEAGVGTNTIKAHPNLVDTMVAENIIQTQAYSLWLDDADAKTGSLLFGGIDTAKYEGELSSLKLYPSDPNAQEIREFLVSWTSMSITTDSGTSSITPPDFPATAALLDSGTTNSQFPGEIVQEVYNILGVLWDGSNSNIPCALRDTAGTVNIGFGGPNGPTIKVPLSEIIIPSLDNTTKPIPFDVTDPKLGDECTVGIQPATNPGDPIIFGDIVLRSMYIVYDLANARVAVAQTKFNATDSNVIAFESLSAEIPSASIVSDEVEVTGFPSTTQTAVVSVTVNDEIGPVVTGTAGLAIASAYSSLASAVTATTTSATSSGKGASQTSDKPKGAGNLLRPFASEQLLLLILATGLFAAGGLFLV